MNVFVKAPNVVVVCATVLAVTAISCVTVLVALGKNATEVTNILTVILSAVGSLGGTGALLYSSAAARSAGTVEDKVVNAEENGSAPVIPIRKENT